ncbi:MAG: homoserine O-acetyltransferase [Betaproteobacteria bacterium]|nr:homoserine O-acetyltransferase [Betaproteobacteria bacterium]
MQKKTFVLESFVTGSGHTLTNVRIGYETYGRLNANRDNAVFIPHMFLGTSHAAGKYRSDDPEPGYWDAIIGPGKPIDTDRYFVVSADTLANTNARDPNVITTGPLSTNPHTGNSYGRHFPRITLSDSRPGAQELIAGLGITRLHAVAGWSMGALQGFEWAARFPDVVPRLVAVGGGAQVDGSTIGWIRAWTRPIVLDPKWHHGDYGTGAEPDDGVSSAIEVQLMTVAQHPWINSAFGRKWAQETANPAEEDANLYAWESQQRQIGRYFASVIDANSYLMAAKAIQTFTLAGEESVEKGLQRVRARVLVIGTPSDIVTVESSLKRDVDILSKRGIAARYVALDGPMGHLEGRFGIGRVAEEIRRFLEDKP